MWFYMCIDLRYYIKVVLEEIENVLIVVDNLMVFCFCFFVKFFIVIEIFLWFIVIFNNYLG